jgi:protein TonB
MKFRFPLFFSVIIHALLIGWMIYIVPVQKDNSPIEISLGLYNLKKPGEPLKGHQVKTKPAPKPSPTSLNPEKKLEVPAETSATTAQAQAGTSEATGAPGQGVGSGGEGGGTDTPLSRYVSKIRVMIAENKQYPKRARYLGQEGTVVLKITIEKSGKIKKLKVEKAPNSQILVNASKDLLKKIVKFPSIPDDVLLQELSLNIPIVYQLED